MPQRKVYDSHAQRQAAYRRRCREAQRQQLQEKGLPTAPAISTIPGTARWRQAIAKAAEFLSLVEEETQDYYDDRSEAWQDSDRAEQFQEKLDAVGQARETVEQIVDI